MKSFFGDVFKNISWKRALAFLAADIVLISLSFYLSFLIRFDGSIPRRFLQGLSEYWVITLIVRLVVFYLIGLYRMSWAHVSFNELINVFKAVSLSSILLGTLFFLMREADLFWSSPLPRSVLILDYFLTLFFIGGGRSARRIYSGLFRRFPQKGRRVLIVGAGDAGEHILRAMLGESHSQYCPVGFVDDDPAKQRIAIHGVQVLGKRAVIPELVEKYEVEELIIAMPSVHPEIIRETVETGRRAGVKHIKILPGFQELLTGQVRLADIREIKLEDLLGREPVNIQPDMIQRYLRDKVILVTGAAGSIGSEICRQTAKFSPKRILALDQDETGLFYMDAELREKFPGLDVEAIVADIRNQNKMRHIFRSYRPQIVFHAAAYKHVSLMEAYPEEAVQTNVLATLIVGEAAIESGAEKFILISTDKAVNPTSVYGASKRVSVMIGQMLNRQGKTKFVAVRFGNVLGSRGSVIPIFQDQIQRKGPVTVTHEDMSRYFMAISEATLLVLQAGAMGQGGEIFVLDMGTPVKIVDLAREMIRLSGYEPDKDIPIVFTGKRPGEKFFEELLMTGEGTVATQHEKIYVAKTSFQISDEHLREQLKCIKVLADQNAKEEIVQLFQELVPTYKPSQPFPQNRR